MEELSVSFLKSHKDEKNKCFQMVIEALSPLAINNFRGNTYFADLNELEFKLLGLIQNLCDIDSDDYNIINSFIKKQLRKIKKPFNRRNTNGYVPLFLELIKFENLDDYKKELNSFDKFIDHQTTLTTRTDG
ncbi:MAG: hypothetical protein ACOCVF_03755, partial [bacterium]